MASFKAKFPVLQELFAKNHRGGLWAPPAGRGLNYQKRFSINLKIIRKLKIHRFHCPLSDFRPVGSLEAPPVLGYLP